MYLHMYQETEKIKLNKVKVKLGGDMYVRVVYSSKSSDQDQFIAMI